MRILLCLFSLCLITAPAGTLAASEPSPRITLDQFRIEPTELRRGDTFVVRARAQAAGVQVGSFLLRTAADVKKADTIPGFPLYTSGKYYVAEAGEYFLKDNGKLDRDPAAGAFALAVDTRGWKEGSYPFAFFASSRPAPGALVTARHDFVVLVKGEQVLIEDQGDAADARSRAITDFSVQPSQVQAGEKVKLTLRARNLQGIQITTPYYTPLAETPPGFHYVVMQKKAYYGVPPARFLPDNGERDQDPAAGAMTLELDTRGWRPGVYPLLVNAIGQAGQPVDYRNAAIRIADPSDLFTVDVAPSVLFGAGTHFGRFLALPKGALLSGDKLSRDGGRTWQAGTGGFGNGGLQLKDGTLLGLGYRCLPILDKEGWYGVERYVSSDGGRRFRQLQAEVYVPMAKAAQGHAQHPGPLFMGSIVERGDGSLVALMAGWFQSDTVICPYGKGRPYSRSYTCESRDGGKTWRYLSTIGYVQIGSEGCNEGAMRRLPGGEWLAVLRTGNASDFNCQDNPIVWSVSQDEGRTWTAPQRTGLSGVYPNLLVLRDGVVAMSYGRPGAMIAFSTDGGRTWSDPTCVDATPYSGYTDIAEVAPGEILLGYGAQHYLDPQTGVRKDQLRLARLRYRRK